MEVATGLAGSCTVGATEVATVLAGIRPGGAMKVATGFSRQIQIAFQKG